jgi:hypothetical protein
MGEWSLPYLRGFIELECQSIRPDSTLQVVDVSHVQEDAEMSTDCLQFCQHDQLIHDPRGRTTVFGSVSWNELSHMAVLVQLSTRSWPLKSAFWL